MLDNQVYSFTGLVKRALDLGIASGLVVKTEVFLAVPEGCSGEDTKWRMNITLMYDDCEGWVDSSEFYMESDNFGYLVNLEKKIKYLLPKIWEE